MFAPEYTITSKTLESIAAAEYARAVIDNTTILPSWIDQLQKETLQKACIGTARTQGKVYSQEMVKKAWDGFANSDETLSGIVAGYKYIAAISPQTVLKQEHLKNLHHVIFPTSAISQFRSNRLPNRPEPDEILANVVELFDWVESLEGLDTHPIITAAIMRATLEYIQPFDFGNNEVSNIFTLMFLKKSNYHFKNFVLPENHFFSDISGHEKELTLLLDSLPDFSSWIEYFSDCFAIEASNIQDKVRLLAKETKVAKASGRVKLTPRQERIVEYLQDYGLLQNKHFPQIFPGISEDSVLRDLKALIEKDIIVKVGSTKSSRYELK